MGHRRHPAFSRHCNPGFENASDARRRRGQLNEQVPNQAQIAGLISYGWRAVPMTGIAWRSGRFDHLWAPLSDGCELKLRLLWASETQVPVAEILTQMASTRTESTDCAGVALFAP
jgi:hypothetical protein